MGEAEIHPYQDTIIITSHIITYGDAADEKVTALIRDEIETMWNEPKGPVYLKGNRFMVTFSISAELQPGIDIEEVYSNTDPRKNYFRIEEYAHGNISFVDGLAVTADISNLKIYTQVPQLLLMNMGTHLAWNIRITWITGAKVFPALCIQGEL